MRTPTWCRRQAAGIGPACVVVIGELLADNALFRLRAAQGVLGLADKHNPARLEAACAKATAAGDPSYRTIKGILAAGTETAPTARPRGDAGAPAHLHGPAQLFADPDPAITVDAVIDPVCDAVCATVCATVIPLPTAVDPDADHPSCASSASGTATALTSSKDAS